MIWHPKVEEGEVFYTWWADYSDYATDKFWDDRYKNILGCNIVIDALPTMTYEESEYNTYCKLAAQAYTLRAYNYFCLVNTYAAPWSEENKDKPGVVKRTSPDIDVSAAERASINEIYTLINEDLERAEEYFKDANADYTKWEITSDAMYFLISRVALFQENWDEVIRVSEEFINQGNHDVYDLKLVNEEQYGMASQDGFWINNIDLTESVFLFDKDRLMGTTGRLAYLAPFNFYNYYSLGFHPSWTDENGLLNLYEDGDLRREIYFTRMYYVGSDKQPMAGQAFPIKSPNTSKTGYARECWRSSEVYLNLAEAYARKENGVSQKAVELLNELREKKFTSEAYKAKTVSDFSSAEDLIKFIWAERRRELCFEEAMRFWDMRRQGMPEVEHVYYYSMNTSKTFVLKQGSPNYLLPIPASETDYNDGIENNPRETITGN